MRILNDIRISRKLTFLSALTALSLIAVIVFATNMLHGQILAERIEKLKNMVEVAEGLATRLDSQIGHGMTREEAIERFRQEIYAMKFGDSYFFMNGLDGTVVVNGANPALNGTNMLDSKDMKGNLLVAEMIDVAKKSGAGLVSYWWHKPGSDVAVEKLTYVVKFAPWNAILATGVYIDDIDAAYHRALLHMAGIAVLIILLTTGLIFAVSRTITGALGSLKSKMDALAAGDLAIEIEESARGDEIGAMGKSVRIFRDNARALKDMEDRQEAMKAEAEASKRQAMQDLALGFEAAIGGIITGVSTTARALREQAETMKGVAEAAARQATSAAAGAVQTSANVQVVAAAADELSSSIAEISRQVAESARVANQAVADTKETDSQVAALSEAAQRVGDVVKLISDIASQTNLLALNATIEAARAGEAGKGFAVVASEVKTLAKQTAHATEEISGQIVSIQDAIASSVGSIRTIGETVGLVNQIATSIASAVEEQDAATKEIARNVQEASVSTGAVSENITATTEAVGETGSAAVTVLEAAGTLSRQAEDLNRKVDDFLMHIRAA